MENRTEPLSSNITRVPASLPSVSFFHTFFSFSCLLSLSSASGARFVVNIKTVELLSVRVKFAIGKNAVPQSERIFIKNWERNHLRLLPQLNRVWYFRLTLLQPNAISRRVVVSGDGEWWSPVSNIALLSLCLFSRVHSELDATE